MIGKIIVATAMTLGGCQQAAPSKPPALETWVFCGVNPADPLAQRKANSLARDAGVDATLGPCLPPPANYTTAYPGSRYANPDQYFQLVVINANAGMETIVYDARIWSDDTQERQRAIDFWTPHLKWIRAWDMGDEFDPSSPDWAVLVHRWNIVTTFVAPATGVGPFTNHLGSAGVLEQALVDLPNQGAHLSYDAYPEVNGVMQASLDLAGAFNGRVNHLMCAINALRHNDYRPTAASIKRHIDSHRNAGCDSILVFGGELPINTPGFSTPSLVSSKGAPTALARSIKQATQG